MEDIKTNKVLVNVVLDRSGSMQSNRQGTISGYNEYIRALRQEKETEYSVSLTQFDAPMAAPELTITYLDRALADVPELTENDYEPRGNTPLYDAIGECIRRVEPKGRGVIVLIITDGMENASQEFNKETITALIKEKEAEAWTFAFLGANIDSYAVGGAMGMSAGNIANYNQANQQALYSNAAQATNARAAAYRVSGTMAARGMAMFDDSQRASMMQPPATGGRPAVPPPFPPKRQAPKGGKKRDWVVKST